jgi:nitroreductase
MQNFLELVQSRQSDRAYNKDKVVEQEKLDYILEAARLAPSACNAQPWKLIVVNNPELRNQTAAAISNMGLNHYAYQAPLQIVIVEEPANFSSKTGGIVKQKHFPHIDLGILAAHVVLAASEQGLGSCIIGWFDEKKMAKLLGIPSNRRPVLVITIGYSTQALREKKRKDMDKIVSYNSYQ